MTEEKNFMSWDDLYKMQLKSYMDDGYLFCTAELRARSDANILFSFLKIP